LKLVKVDQRTKELLSEHLKKTRRGDALKTKNAKKAAIMRNIPNKKAGTVADDNDDDESKYLNLELVDEDTLKEVANIGNGQFYMAQSLDSLSDVFGTIDKLEKVKIERRKITEAEELFAWPLSISAAALFLALLLSLTLLHSAPEPSVT
jgi:hypothetical protein